jgi:hypothetical protein
MKRCDLAVGKLLRIKDINLPCLVIEEITRWDEWQVMYADGKCGIFTSNQLLQFFEDIDDVYQA